MKGGSRNNPGHITDIYRIKVKSQEGCTARHRIPEKAGYKTMFESLTAGAKCQDAWSSFALLKPTDGRAGRIDYRSMILLVEFRYSSFEIGESLGR